MSEWKAWWEKVYAFLQRHARGAAYPTPSLKMGVTKFNAQIRFMVQLYFCLSKFVNFYPTFVRSNASRTRPVFPPKKGLGQQNQQDQKWPQLSNTELLRLQRGLLRYELFCRLVGLPSIAVSCNFDLYYAFNNATSGSQIWIFNPFSEILPIDEVEEIICASVYVRDLYDSLRWNAIEEFHNYVLDLDQGRGDGDTVLDKDVNDEKKTAEHWFSQDGRLFLDFRYLRPCHVFDRIESMSRLGLVFLDRLTRSSIAERRELMRHSLTNLLGPEHPSFLWRYWYDVVYKRCTAEGISLGAGPYCNSILQTSISSSSINKLIGMGDHHRLRRLGWVFFDDKTKLRSLGLPHHARPSAMRHWLKKPENLRLREFPLQPEHHRLGQFPLHPEMPLQPEMPDSALAARFTEHEWNEQVMDKYSLKDHHGDYQAMSQFAAGARAVVDFTSTQLPHFD